MGTQIDRLEIEIEAQAQKANQQLEGLSRKLDKVSEALGKLDNSGLGTLVRGIDSLKKSVSGTKDLKASDFSKLARNIEKLGNVDASKLQKVGNALKYLSIAVKELDGKNISIKINDGDFKKMAQTGKKASLSADELAEKFKYAGKIDLSEAGVSDLENLKKAAVELEKQLDKLFAKEEKTIATSEGAPSGKAWENLQYDINAAVNKLDIYRAKIAELESIKETQRSAFPIYRGEPDVTADEWSRTASVAPDSMKYNADAMRMVFGQAAENIERWDDAVKQFGVNASAVLNNLSDIPVSLDLSTYEGQIRKLKADLGEMRSKGLGAGNSQYDEKYLELEKVLQKQKEYKKYMAELAKLSNMSADAIGGEGKSAGLTADEMEALARKKSRASRSNRELAKEAEKTTRSLIREGNAGSGIFGLFGKSKGQSRKLGSFFSDLSKGLSDLGKKSKKSGNRAMNGLSIGRMVGMSVLYSTVFRMISTINEGFVTGMQNLAQYSDRTNRSISSLMSAMTQLKNSFATAFAPILDVVAPHLVTFINLISRAVTYVGMFFAALSGRSSFTKAIPVTEDYAASLDKTSDSADKANESTKELEKTLLGFDEINKLSDNTDRGTSGSGSSDGYTPPSPSEMFEEVPIDKEILKWADKFREALESIRKTAEPTTAALKKLYNQGLKKLGNFSVRALNDLWHNYLKPMGKWMLADNSGLPRFFNITNDLLNEINWGRLNRVLAKFFTMLQKPTKFTWNALMDFYEYFLKPVAVWTMGEGILQLVDALTDFGNKIQWEKLNNSLARLWDALAPFAKSVGQGLVNFFKDLLSVGADFINKVVPGGLNSLADALKKINPETAERIGYALGELFTAFLAFKGLTWFGSIFGDGGAIGKGFSLLAAHPFGAIALGISGIVLALDAFGVIDVDWDWLWSKISQMKDILMEFVSKVDWEKLVQSIGNLFEALAPFVKGFADGFLDFFDFMLNEIGAPLLNSLADIIGALADALKKMDPDELEAIGKAIGTIAASIAAIKISSSLITGLAGLFSGLSKVKTVLSGAGFGAAVTGAATANGAAGGVATGTGWMTSFGAFMTSTAPTLVFALAGLAETINVTQTAADRTNYGVLLEALTALKDKGDITQEDFEYLYKTLSNAQWQAPFEDGMVYLRDALQKSGVSSEEFESTLSGVMDRLKISAPNQAKIIGAGIGDGTAEGIESSKNKVENASKGIVDRIKDLFTSKSDGFDIHSPSKYMYGIGTNLVNGLNNALGDKWGTIDSKLSKLIGHTSKSINDSLRDIGTMGKDAISNLKSAFTNLHIPLPHLQINWRNLTLGTSSFSIPSFGISWYAKGGFPNTGELFMARENGINEMVGRMGNRSAVANNDQIVDGIAAGVGPAVYNAVVAAMDNYDGSQLPEVNIYVGGKKVTDVVIEEVNKRTKSTGRCPIII
ncbi:hypothetical protein GKG47_11925 [Lactonifactor sp. BIOML-A3]|uniref:hypothetical protein n=1 Tax=unclassified Lactonifactor TaxID=2636670 RepID=UPI0012AEF9C0|nr:MULTISPECIES: hypothetical protein [unclassified Lactonifactor]MSA01032.1 hypothetical protein [Lactonifactor sp. BIOML-A5]MSA10322.1 hypothetical protein [Lactonifactor sp. BIOML-A4]MSA13132.1 hypothetical protein [Lactonifactor sp. BIOML-A3]MSA19294.1 hypothetical protein [Lactonifactor sp. BIOML-A2]MSA38371.1 hypothetical protein [Lactonifactor sp. BIOML-A1]